MKTANALPLVIGLLNKSAKSPPTTDMGLEALIPHMRRKTSSEGQLGATAHAKVKSVKTRKLLSMTILRP